jgi:hypothetical protein
VDETVRELVNRDGLVKLDIIRPFITLSHLLRKDGMG